MLAVNYPYYYTHARISHAIHMKSRCSKIHLDDLVMLMTCNLIAISTLYVILILCQLRGLLLHPSLFTLKVVCVNYTKRPRNSNIFLYPSWDSHNLYEIEHKLLFILSFLYIYTLADGPSLDYLLNKN